MLTFLLAYLLMAQPDFTKVYCSEPTLVTAADPKTGIATITITCQTTGACPKGLLFLPEFNDSTVNNPNGYCVDPNATAINL